MRQRPQEAVFGPFAAFQSLNMEFLLRKLSPFSEIRFTLIFMTQTIPLTSNDILLWGNRWQVAC
jgi:hypothetical protein